MLFLFVCTLLYKLSLLSIYFTVYFFTVFRNLLLSHSLQFTFEAPTGMRSGTVARSGGRMGGIKRIEGHAHRSAAWSGACWELRCESGASGQSWL